MARRDTPLDLGLSGAPAAAGSVEETLDASLGEAPVGQPALRLGQRAGRFVLLSEIGRGGMGTVFAAYDEHLGRKVAIKLLHARRTTDAADVSYHQRLLREAQAMARIAHPNVVSVYEAGETGGQVFLAMEFVDGVPLSAWQKQKGRSWQAVLEMYLQAGRGLAAAHARKLVHRDFKPDNVWSVEQMDLTFPRPSEKLGEGLTRVCTRTPPQNVGSSRSLAAAAILPPPTPRAAAV